MNWKYWDPFEWVLAAILGVCALLLIGLLVYFADAATARSMRGMGTVVACDYQPGYMEYVPAGKVLLPVYHDPAYRITVRVDDNEITGAFPQPVRIGDTFPITYSVGRITGARYLTRIKGRYE